jgi:thioredoxin 1
MILSVTEQTFNQEVLDSPTLVIVNFWAPWCGLCRRINPMLTHLQAEWGKSFKLVQVNADDNFKLANRYRLMTLPTLLLFEEGQVIHRLDSVLSLELLQRELSKIISQHSSHQAALRSSAAMSVK